MPSLQSVMFGLWSLPVYPGYTYNDVVFSCCVMYTLHVHLNIYTRLLVDCISGGRIVVWSVKCLELHQKLELFWAEMAFLAFIHLRQTRALVQMGSIVSLWLVCDFGQNDASHPHYSTIIYPLWYLGCRVHGPTGPKDSYPIFGSGLLIQGFIGNPTIIRKWPPRISVQKPKPHSQAPDITPSPAVSIG